MELGEVGEIYALKWPELRFRVPIFEVNERVEPRSTDFAIHDRDQENIYIVFRFFIAVIVSAGRPPYPS